MAATLTPQIGHKATWARRTHRRQPAVWYRATVGRASRRASNETAYLRGQMDAGRLRQVGPRTAVQSLLGPLLIYAMVPPDSWAAAFGELPPPEQTLTELVDIWVRGMQPAPARA